ncbi:MAG: adenosine deaminase [bacterium]
MNSKIIPKVELHCHLDGILDPPMVRDIYRNDSTFPINPVDFERAYPITSFESFFRWWDFIDPIEGELAYFYPILSRHIERLKAQSVQYSEVMVAAGELPIEPYQAVEKVQAFREWVNQQEAGNIQIEFLVAIGRNKSLEVMEQIAERALALYEAELIVGVALAGPEPGNPVKPFHKTFAQFHEAGLGIEIHAGEWCGPESVWDALEYGYPDRIGHGVSLFQDPKLIDIFQERQTHIELCPTSNLKTGSISHIEEHPVKRARELGLNFGINTDDPGPFECSMMSEYMLLSDVFRFEEDDFRKIYTNSLKARFQPNLRIKVQTSNWQNPFSQTDERKHGQKEK